MTIKSQRCEVLISGSGDPRGDPTEACLIFSDRLAPSTGEPVLVFAHGYGTLAANFFMFDSPFTPAPEFNVFTLGGWKVVVVDAGGSSTWGNDTGIGALANAVAYAKNALGAPKVVMWGYSMGGCNTINYAYRHPTDISGMILLAPVANLDAFETNAGYKVAVDAAYGNNYAVNAVGHKPLLLAPTMGMPARIFVAQDDSVVNPADVQNFYNLLNAGDKQYTLLPGGGHTTAWSYMAMAPLLAWANQV